MAEVIAHRLVTHPTIWTALCNKTSQLVIHIGIGLQMTWIATFPTS